MKNEPASYCLSQRLRVWRPGAGAKASLNRAHVWQVVDPKPRELPMARVKVR